MPSVLLLQIRENQDPMRLQEVQAFSGALELPVAQIKTLDLLSELLTVEDLAGCDVAFIGGSGSFSVLDDADWLDRARKSLLVLVEQQVPTFASCWGFQALAQALGGRVKRQPESAELGTLDVSLTERGRNDELFGKLPPVFGAHMGHEDSVVELPRGAVRLAETQRNLNQAYRIDGKPIYATQFHPELTARYLFERVRQYPSYLERIAGMTLEQFEAATRETPEANSLLCEFYRLHRKK